MGQVAEIGIIMGLKGASPREEWVGARELEPQVLKLSEAPQHYQAGQPWWESC